MSKNALNVLVAASILLSGTSLYGMAPSPAELLFAAARDGNVPFVQNYLATPELTNEAINPTVVWLTPLHIAAKNGHANIVRLFAQALQTRRLNVNPPIGGEQLTPLHFALWDLQLDAIQVLVGEFGVNPLAIATYRLRWDEYDKTRAIRQYLIEDIKSRHPERPLPTWLQDTKSNQNGD